MPLIKTLSQTLKQDKEKFKVPKSVQQAIPIRKIWPDGIFQVESKYSRTFRFTDINYSIASKADKTEMFLDYSELLNALDSGCTAKITLNNRKINKEEFEQSLLIPMKGDGLDEYRKEYNDMLLSKISGTNNSIYQERYLTISVHKKNIDEARTYFARVGTDIITHLAKLSSIGEELDAEQRLQIFRDFFKADVPQSFPFDMKAFAKKGHSFKDWICPDTMEFHNDHFKLGEQYGRVLFMEDYASYVKDEMISELCSLGRNLMLSIDIIPVPTDEAVREIQNRLLGVETNVTNWQRRQNANNNFSAVVPYDMELQRKETKEMLDDLTTRDQRMMFGILTMVHMADSKKQLDSDTETLYSIARKHLCQMATLKWQQVDGLNTVLPYGLRKIDAVRTLTTESTAVLIPFHTQEIMQPGGIYYGQNAVSKNMLVADRRKLLNGNSFRLGVSGSGKSFSAKEEIVDLALSTEDDILILDPESEFASLVEALNGEVIRISATSDTHLNALDMDSAYGNDRNPLIEKSEFILSLFEQLVGAGNLSAKEKSILDRCTADVYRDYMRGGYKGQVPTLKDLYRQLMLQPEEEARGLALSSELFINGSLNTFAQETNVNTKSPREKPKVFSPRQAVDAGAAAVPPCTGLDMVRPAVQPHRQHILHHRRIFHRSGHKARPVLPLQYRPLTKAEPVTRGQRVVLAVARSRLRYDHQQRRALPGAARIGQSAPALLPVHAPHYPAHHPAVRCIGVVEGHNLAAELIHHSPTALCCSSTRPHAGNAVRGHPACGRKAPAGRCRSRSRCRCSPASDRAARPPAQIHTSHRRSRRAPSRQRCPRYTPPPGSWGRCGAYASVQFQRASKSAGTRSRGYPPRRTAPYKRCNPACARPLTP